MFNKFEDGLRSVENVFLETSPEDLSRQLLEEPYEEGTNQLEEVFCQTQPNSNLKVASETQFVAALQDSTSQQFLNGCSPGLNQEQGQGCGLRTFEPQVQMLNQGQVEGYAVNQLLYDQEQHGQYFNSKPLQKSGSRVQLGVPAVEVQQLLAFHKLQSNDTSVSKKQRMRWIPALHNMFVEVVHNLGGPWQATPKNIVAAMKSQGVQSKLDINHIKSHLQKYRQSIRGGSSSTSRSGGKRKVSEMDDEYGENDEDEEEEEVGNVLKPIEKIKQQKTASTSVLQSSAQLIQQETQKTAVFQDQINSALNFQQQQQEDLQNVCACGFQSKQQFESFQQAGQKYRKMMIQLLEQYRNWNQGYEEIMRRVNFQNFANQHPKNSKLSCSTNTTATTCNYAVNNNNNNNNNQLNKDWQQLQSFDDQHFIF